VPEDLGWSLWPVGAGAALPGALALRKEAEGFSESLLDLTTQEQVQAVLTDFNARVEADWRRPVPGPGLGVQAYQVDVEQLLERWRALRTVAVSGTAAGPDGRPSPFPSGRRRRRRLCLRSSVLGSVLRSVLRSSVFQEPGPDPHAQEDQGHG
jgi:hypothetical protein